MLFDTDNLNPFTRFYFDESKPEDGWVDIRTANADAQEAISEKCGKKRAEFKHNPVTRRMERIEFLDVDAKAFAAALWDYCIGDEWLLLDKNRTEIPNSPAMKVRLMKESKTFNTFVSKCLDKLNGVEAEEAVEAEKNS